MVTLGDTLPPEVGVCVLGIVGVREAVAVTVAIGVLVCVEVAVGVVPGSAVAVT